MLKRLDLSSRFFLFGVASIVAWISLAVGSVLVFFTTFFSSSDRAFREELNMIPPPPNIAKWTFGYNETAADSLWLRVIQDFSVCENAKDGVAHATAEASAASDAIKSKCSRGWVFKMLDAITDLAPNWKMPYSLGAIMLSVVVDDRVGATMIFDKGLKQFPMDYNLNYRAAYHYMWEEKAPEKAAPLLLRAAQVGGASWLYALAGKMYSEAGQAELAKGVLENALQETKEGDPGRVRIEKRLSEIEAKIRKESLKKKQE